MIPLSKYWFFGVVLCDITTCQRCTKAIIHPHYPQGTVVSVIKPRPSAIALESELEFG